MTQKVLFAAVAILLFGHILSAPSPASTTEVQPMTASYNTPATANTDTESISTDCEHHKKDLEMDDSKPADLGDIPIVPEHELSIINRRYVPLRNCKELRDEGFNKSGLYVIQPGDGGEFIVYCDMTLLGGGWTVIQRRLNDKVSFRKKYASYEHGFGDFTENFWLGLSKITKLTVDPSELYIGLEEFYDSQSTFARYSSVSVGGRDSGYVLRISGFDESSTAGDSLESHDGQRFSTYDRDQDRVSVYNCAKLHRGGWWYHRCHDSNLNGHYYEEGYFSSPSGFADGISWQTWLGDRYSLKSTVIAIRQTN